jgi:hypothetical protein
MLKEYAREFLIVGTELTETSRRLFETELVTKDFNTVGPDHARHKEALAALRRAHFASLMLPLGTFPREIERAFKEYENYENGGGVDRLNRFPPEGDAASARCLARGRRNGPSSAYPGGSEGQFPSAELKS